MKPYHFGLWLKRHPGGVATQRQHLAAVRLLFDHLEYMNAGGSLDIAQRIAGHSELSTTKIYDRSQDRVTIAEIERVSFEPSSELT